MIQPQKLKRGDLAGIVAPAGFIEKFYIDYAVELFQKWGLKVKTGENIFKRYNQFAGTDEQRAGDFQNMLDNPAIKAIICARGGYGSIRILEKLDFKDFLKYPKWIVGYSDITIFHIYLSEQLNCISIHSAMPLNYVKPDITKDSIDTLKYTLFSEKKLEYEIKADKLNKPGRATGILTGGNLSILYSLLGTKYDFDTTNKILFIEDIGEYYYKLDRMMYSMKLAGKFSGLKGLVVGSFTEMPDNNIPFGSSSNEIISDIVSEYNFPVLFNFPAGHQPDNRALIIGAEVEMNVTIEKAELSFK